MADEKCVRDPRHDCFGLEAATAPRRSSTAASAAVSKNSPKGEGVQGDGGRSPLPLP